MNTRTIQCGPRPATLDLRPILQKCDKWRATSNEMMYKITDSQYLKLKTRR